MCYFKKNGIFIVFSQNICYFKKKLDSYSFSYTCVISRKKFGYFILDVKGKVDTKSMIIGGC